MTAVKCNRTVCQFVAPGTLILFLCAALPIGCGAAKKTYPVKGKVVSATGIAPTFGTVEFRSLADGKIASGLIARDGTFQLTTFAPNDGAVLGEHQVILVRLINIEDGVPLHKHGHAVEIPVRYADYETSDLRATVEAVDPNEITIKFDSES